MDTAMNQMSGPAGRETGFIAGRSLDEWNAAYAKVENYFYALRIRNKTLLGQSVLRVLDRAMNRAPAEPTRSATELAVEEMDRLIHEWFADVLQIPPERRDRTLSTKGRLALLLAGHARQMAGPVPASGSLAGGICECHARGLFAGGAGISALQNDAASL
jgi:hypothetical protein